MDKDGIWSEWGRGFRIKVKFGFIEEVLERGGATLQLIHSLKLIGWKVGTGLERRGVTHFPLEWWEFIGLELITLDWNFEWFIKKWWIGILIICRTFVHNMIIKQSESWSNRGFPKNITEFVSNQRMTCKTLDFNVK